MVCGTTIFWIFGKTTLQPWALTSISKVEIEVESIKSVEKSNDDDDDDNDDDDDFGTSVDPKIKFDAKNGICIDKEISFSINDNKNENCIDICKKENGIDNKNENCIDTKNSDSCCENSISRFVRDGAIQYNDFLLLKDIDLADQQTELLKK